MRIWFTKEIAGKKLDAVGSWLHRRPSVYDNQSLNNITIKIIRRRQIASRKGRSKFRNLQQRPGGEKTESKVTNGRVAPIKHIIILRDLHGLSSSCFTDALTRSLN